MTDWIKEIRERADKATSGPWGADCEEWPGNKNLRYWVNTHYDGLACAVSKDDAEFIAHARDDIPKLLDEVERLREVYQDELLKTINLSEDILKIKKEFNEQHEGNMDALQGWYDDYQELKQENERLRKALIYYANHCECLGTGISQFGNDPKYIMECEKCRLARKALGESK